MFVINTMKMSILLDRFKIDRQSHFESIGICMRDILWLLGHLMII